VFEPNQGLFTNLGLIDGGGEASHKTQLAALVSRGEPPKEKKAKVYKKPKQEMGENVEMKSLIFGSAIGLDQ
jgi:hypothetical protein